MINRLSKMAANSLQRIWKKCFRNSNPVQITKDGENFPWHFALHIRNCDYCLTRCADLDKKYPEGWAKPSPAITAASRVSSGSRSVHMTMWPPSSSVYSSSSAPSSSSSSSSDEDSYYEDSSVYHTAYTERITPSSEAIHDSGIAIPDLHQQHPHQHQQYASSSSIKSSSSSVPSGRPSADSSYQSSFMSLDAAAAPRPSDEYNDRFASPPRGALRVVNGECSSGGYFPCRG